MHVRNDYDVQGFTIEMKKNILAFVLAMSLSVSAHTNEQVAGATFGASFDETRTVLKGNFGEPNSQTEDKLVYLNKEFEGLKADRVEIGFQQVNGASKLNQARFYFVCPTKQAAIVKMKTLAKRMESKYSVSYDEEDGGTAFYKGGRSPLGIGSLFTIYVSPYQGKWTCQLRYGKFLFK